MPRPLPAGTETHEIRVTRLTVCTPGDGQMFSEMTTQIEIDDEAAGEFLRITQQSCRTDAKQAIAIDQQEWPALRAAIDWMIEECHE